MKWKIRRALALFTTFLMLFSSIPANTLTAFAADDAAEIVEEYDGAGQDDDQDVTANEADPDGDEAEDQDKPDDGDDQDDQDKPDDGDADQDQDKPDGGDADQDDRDQNIPDDGDDADTDEESDTVKVSFDANGGSFDDGNSKRSFDQKKGEKITMLPDDPEREGYEFTGWCLDEDGEYTLSLAGYVTDEDVTFYAGWAETLADEEVPEETEVLAPDRAGTGLTLDGNGGMIRYYDYKVDDYKTAAVVNYVPSYDSDYYWKDLSAYSPEREGYFFTGWYAEPACTTRLSDDDNDSYLAERPDAGTTLYAGWSNEYVTVTCVFGDSAYYCGPDTNWEKVHEMDVEVPKNKAFYRSNYLPDTYYISCDDGHYTFDLWGDAPQADKEVTFKFSEDTTLYAVYKKSKIQITYDTNLTDGGYFREYSGGKTVRAGQKTEFIDKNSRKTIYVSSSDSTPRNDDPRKVFAGWYTDEGLTTPVAKYSDWSCTEEWDGTGSSYYIKTGNDDFTLYAKWEESDDVCILTFDPHVEGGYFKDYNTIYEVVEKYQLGCRAGESISETIYNPINPDKAYQCVGWYSDEECTKQVIAVGKYEGQYNSSVYLDGYTFPEGVTEVTLYAKWVKTYATVTFDAGDDGSYRYYDGNGYSEGNRISFKVNSSGKAETCPDDPVSTDPHKKFAGWYLNGKKIESLYDYKFSTTAGAMINVVAQWTSCYAVTVDYNGGYYNKWEDGGYVHVTTPLIIKVPCGASLEAGDNYISDPNYEDDEKVFRGWFLSTDTEHKNMLDRWSFVPESDCTIVALWASNYSVTFDAKAGTFTDGKSTRSYRAVEGTVYMYNNGAEIPEEPEIDDDTKVFGGWTLNGEKVEREDILNATVTGNVTYTAQYVPAYAVTFDLKGGTFISKTPNLGDCYKIKVATGESIRGKVPTVRSADVEHKVFAGWYTDENCAPESLVDPYEMKIDAPITLYAGWSECYKLTFHANFVNNVSGSERFGDSAKFANGSENVVVKVVKGTAYRYGEDYGEGKESVDTLFESPEIADAAGGYQLPWWWTNADKTGDKYVLTRYNSHIEKKEGNYIRYEYFTNMYGFIPTSDMDFYADITTETVELSFNANGGKFRGAEDSKYYGFYETWIAKGYNPSLNDAQTVWTITVPKGITYGEVNDTPYNFESYKKGYKSYEWAYKESSCKNRAYSDFVINKNTTLYCSWYNPGGGGGSSSGGKSAEITYHAGEGYLDDDRDRKSTRWSYFYGTTEWQNAPLPSIDDDTRAFAGWYYDAELTEPYPTAYQMIKYEYGRFYSYLLFPEKVDDLYAAYEPAYNVVFDANGGYFDEDYNRTKDPGLNMRETTTLKGKAYPGQSLIISEYTKRVRRDGDKIFDGWYTDKACSEGNRVSVYALDEDAELYKPTESVRLYAKWVDYEAAPVKITARVNKDQIDIGESAALSVTIDSEVPIEENSVHWFISWESIGKLNVNREKPAKLEIDGKVIGRAQGEVCVYAMVNGVRSNDVEIKVSNETVQSTITLTDEEGHEFTESVALLKGEGLVINGVIEPLDTADDLAQAVVWESSPTAVAEVTPAGDGRNANVIATGEGTATITATLGKKTASVTVVVTDPVQFSEKELIMTAKTDAGRLVNVAVLKSVPNVDVEIKAFTTSECETESDLVAIAKGDAEQTSTKKMLPVTISPTAAGCSIAETQIITIQAKVVIDGRTYTDVCALTLNPQPAAGDVTASVASGSVVDKGTKVLLNTSTSGTEIYYTKNGSDPDPAYDEEGNLPAGTYHYDDAIVINETVTIKAIAVRDGRKNSAIQTFTYKVESWGDVEEYKAKFENDLSLVPTGIWYLIDGEVYKGDGNTSLTRIYTGAKITFNDKILVFSGTARLIENRDYTITYANNTAVMQDLDNKKAPSFTVKGKGNYAKTAVFKFKITPASVADIALTSESVMPVAAGPKVKLINTKPTVSFAGKKLTYNKDYLLEYYEGNAVDPDKLIDDPNTEFVTEAGRVYTIRVVAKEGGSFTGVNGVTVTVRSIDSKDKLYVKTSTLKAGDAKGKAIKLPYYLDEAANPYYYNTDGTVNFEAVFDNSSAEKTPLAYVYAKKVTEPLTYGVDYTVEPAGDNANAGKYTFIVKGITEGKGDDEIKYVGTKTAAYEITGVNLSKMKVAGLLSSVEYTGGALDLDDIFNANDKVVTAHNAAVEDPSDVWTGVTLYTTYKEKVGKTSVTRYVTLQKGVDYTVTFDNTGVVGKHTLIFQGIGAYSGTIKKTVTVKAYNLNDAAKGDNSMITVTLSEPAPVYRKAGATPEVTVRYGGKLLKNNIDYTVSYKNNKKIVADYNELKPNARPVVVVKGKGNFAGTNQSVYFNIVKANVADSVVLEAADVAYNPKGKSGYFLVTPKLMDNGTAVTNGKNKDIDAIAKNAYEYYYAEDTMVDGREKSAGERLYASDNIPVGTMIEVRVKVTISNAEKGSKIRSTESPYYADGEGNTAVLKGYYRLIGEGMDIGKYTVKLKKDAVFNFNNGNDVVPVKSEAFEISYKVKGQKEPVILTGDDYEVVSVTNNKAVGTATVVLRGKGEYGGTKTVKFKITAGNIKAVNND